jgi:hypothetical protein
MSYKVIASATGLIVGEVYTANKMESLSAALGGIERLLALKTIEEVLDPVVVPKNPLIEMNTPIGMVKQVLPKKAGQPPRP